MNAVDLLEQQHREVDKLFKQAKKEKGEQKQATFIQIADALSIHASIEEKVFYPAAMADNTEDLLQESLQEHLSMKRILADMLDLPVDDERFDAKLTVLEEQVQHHVEEEEKTLFPRATRELGKTRLEALGEEMESLVTMLQETEPHEAIREETEEAPNIQ